MAKDISARCHTPADVIRQCPELLLECLRFYMASHRELETILKKVEGGISTFSIQELSLVQTAAHSYSSVCEKNLRNTFLHIAVIFVPDADFYRSIPLDM